MKITVPTLYHTFPVRVCVFLFYFRFFRLVLFYFLFGCKAAAREKGSSKIKYGRSVVRFGQSIGWSFFFAVVVVVAYAVVGGVGA